MDSNTAEVQLKNRQNNKGFQPIVLCPDIAHACEINESIETATDLIGRALR